MEHSTANDTTQGSSEVAAKSNCPFQRELQEGSRPVPNSTGRGGADVCDNRGNKTSVPRGEQPGSFWKISDFHYAGDVSAAVIHESGSPPAFADFARLNMRAKMGKDVELYGRFAPDSIWQLGAGLFQEGGPVWQSTTSQESRLLGVPPNQVPTATIQRAVNQQEKRTLNASAEAGLVVRELGFIFSAGTVKVDVGKENSIDANALANPYNPILPFLSSPGVAVRGAIKDEGGVSFGYSLRAFSDRGRAEVPEGSPVGYVENGLQLQGEGESPLSYNRPSFEGSLTVDNNHRQMPLLDKAVVSVGERSIGRKGEDYRFFVGTGTLTAEQTHLSIQCVKEEYAGKLSDGQKAPNLTTVNFQALRHIAGPLSGAILASYVHNGASDVAGPSGSKSLGTFVDVQFRGKDKLIHPFTSAGVQIIKYQIPGTPEKVLEVGSAGVRFGK
ncbi:MAG TPA: hypothetical protein V6C97_33500 [Oculatellaceae cyanobacterium]